MSIDWITVIAQIANFLLLVWLLKRFLYRPILDGIDAREEEIAKRMAEAGIAEQKALATQALYREQQAELEATQKTKVTEALKAAEAQRDTLLAEARSKLEQEQKDWRSYLQVEREKFVQQLQLSGEQALLELTRKALHDLADAELEATLVRHISKRLAPLAAELKDAAGENQNAVATTHEALPEAAQVQLQADINQLLPSLTLKFVIDPEQAPGLVLRVGGAQIAWTIDSYADELTEQLNKRHE